MLNKVVKALSRGKRSGAAADKSTDNGPETIRDKPLNAKASPFRAGSKSGATGGANSAGPQSGGAQSGGSQSGAKPEQRSAPSSTTLPVALATVLSAPPSDPDEYWEVMRPATLDAVSRRKSQLYASRDDTSHAAFDVLRTRLLQALKARGWTRVMITSPTQGCGKTFVTANLAVSLSRVASCRTVLMDMELRKPNLGAALGIYDKVSMRDYLGGQRSTQAHLRRVGLNLAVGLNHLAISDSAEVLQDPQTAHTLHRMHLDLAPDVVLFDMPAALGSDDVSAFLPQVDGVLLVVDGRNTRAGDIAECERMFAGQTQLLGIILNKAEAPMSKRFSYRQR